MGSTWREWVRSRLINTLCVWLHGYILGAFQRTGTVRGLKLSADEYKRRRKYDPCKVFAEMASIPTGDGVMFAGSAGCDQLEPKHKNAIWSSLWDTARTLIDAAATILLVALLLVFDISLPRVTVHISIGDRSAMKVTARHLRISLVSTPASKSRTYWGRLQSFQIVMSGDLRAEFPGGMLSAAGLKCSVEVDGTELYRAFCRRLHTYTSHAWQVIMTLMRPKRKMRVVSRKAKASGHRLLSLTAPDQGSAEYAVVKAVALHVASIDASIDLTAVPASLYLFAKDLVGASIPGDGTCAGSSGGPWKSVPVRFDFGAADLRVINLSRGLGYQLALTGGRCSRQLAREGQQGSVGVRSGGQRGATVYCAFSLQQASLQCAPAPGSDHGCSDGSSPGRVDSIRPLLVAHSVEGSSTMAGVPAAVGSQCTNKALPRGITLRVRDMYVTPEWTLLGKSQTRTISPEGLNKPPSTRGEEHQDYPSPLCKKLLPLLTF